MPTTEAQRLAAECKQLMDSIDLEGRSPTPEEEGQMAP